MIAVLDASAAVELVLQRESAARFSELIASADLVIAPTLLITEATNVFWKYQKFADYPYDDCERAIDHIVSLPDEYVDEIELYREAFSLGCMLNQPVYDMIYLVLARRNSASLLTMDKKLIAAAEKVGVRRQGLR
ncbi:MAG: type II toxin-antitoxin system VapC family toxin [Sedimenticola sp.]